ncbi:EAL domain-containing protein [Demequina sediminis]
MELKLCESEERYRSLYEDNVDAVSTIDIDGKVMYANNATAQLMGYSPDEVVGKNFLPFIAADRIEETAAHFGRVAQGQTVQYETAIITADGTDPETLLRRADSAMLAAKQVGRRRVALHHELSGQEEARGQRMELALRSAMSNRELSLAYQPQVARWRDAGLGDILISVNISVDQFYDIEFAHHLEAAIELAGISPESLVLEITESIASQSEIVVDQLHRFAGIGVRIAIDDFGTGYSSLRYLKDFPVDYVKVDRSFVDQMETSKPDRDLVSTIVALAQNFGLATIAEGVETPEQATRLRELGAEYAQGFLFGRPMPAAEFEEWLASRE